MKEITKSFSIGIREGKLRVVTNPKQLLLVTGEIDGETAGQLRALADECDKRVEPQADLLI